MLALTKKDWEELQQVNDHVNSKVEYKCDIDLFKKEDYWEIATSEGDCEDYSLAKIKQLVAVGFDRRDLRVALCWTEGGEYHAVLSVDTDDGTYILDNRRNTILPWTECGYTWDKREVPGKLLWQKIGK